MIVRHSFSCIIPLVIIVFGWTFVASDIYEACKTIQNRTFVATNISCSHYIYCDGDDSYEGVCADEDYFNERYQTCDPKELVDCKLDNSSNRPTPTELTTTTTTTTATTRKTTSQVTTTNNGIVTASPIISTSLATLVTTSSTADIIATTTAIQTSSLTPISSVDTTPATDSTNASATSSSPLTNTTVIISFECPPTDNPQRMVFVPHPTSCSDYFICYHGVALQMHCSSMLHFNTNTGKCDYAENVRCQANFSKPKEQCQPHTVDLFPHQSNCNYFYYCRNGFLLLQQCPFTSGWDYEKRACIALDQVKCFNKTNRGI